MEYNYGGWKARWTTIIVVRAHGQAYVETEVGMEVGALAVTCEERMAKHKGKYTYK